jgi:hypothetical protein
MRKVIDFCEVEVSDVIPIISLSLCSGPHDLVEYICLHALHRVIDQAEAYLEFKTPPK